MPAGQPAGRRRYFFFFGTAFLAAGFLVAVFLAEDFAFASTFGASSSSTGLTFLGFASFFGGTSLRIMVGVILDSLQQIETQLLMRQYDGLMKSGRIQGRQSVTNAVI